MLISKVEMTLSKVDLEVAKYYVDILGSKKNSKSFEEIFDVISKEYSLTKSLVPVSYTHLTLPTILLV